MIIAVLVLTIYAIVGLVCMWRALLQFGRDNKIVKLGR